MQETMFALFYLLLFALQKPESAMLVGLSYDHVMISLRTVHAACRLELSTCVPKIVGCDCYQEISQA